MTNRYWALFSRALRDQTGEARAWFRGYCFPHALSSFEEFSNTTSDPTGSQMSVALRRPSTAAQLPGFLFPAMGPESRSKTGRIQFFAAARQTATFASSSVREFKPLGD
jgi:hypothetical protein